MKVKVLVAQSFPTLRPHGLYPTRILCPRNSPDKTPGLGSHFLLQGIVPTQGSNSGLLHCRWTLYHLSHQCKCQVNNVQQTQRLFFGIFLEFFWLLIIFFAFTEFVTMLLLFCVLSCQSGGMWDPSSTIRNPTHTPCNGRWSLSHWTARLPC